MSRTLCFLFAICTVLFACQPVPPEDDTCVDWLETEDWPVDTVHVGGETLSKQEAIELLAAHPKGSDELRAALIEAELSLPLEPDPQQLTLVYEAHAWLLDHSQEQGATLTDDAEWLATQLRQSISCDT